MGYGYHSSGSNPGPLSPLHGGDPWSRYSLEWTVEDYIKWGCPPDKIIVGLPLYGREWPTTDNSVPGTATADSSSVTFSKAWTYAESNETFYDTVTDTPYMFRSSTSQLWYDDTDSIGVKIAWAVETELLGVGFWALNYDGGDPDFWQMVSDQTTSDEPVDTGSLDSGTDSASDSDARPGRGSSWGDEDTPRACGCDGSGGLGAAWVLTLILVSRSRRRAPDDS